MKTAGEIIYEMVWADARKRERWQREDRIKEINHLINQRVIRGYNEGLEQGERIKQAELQYSIMQLLQQDANKYKNRVQISQPIHGKEEV
jgi:hypothetical protein